MHADPVNGIDPTGESLVGAMVSGFSSGMRMAEGAVKLATLNYIRGQILLAQSVNVLRILNFLRTGGSALLGFIFYRGQMLAHTFNTWLPRIELAFDILDVATGFLDLASNAILEATDDFDSMGVSTRGIRVEDIAGANLAGNVSGIDDIRYVDGTEDAFATSIRSHDKNGPEALRKAIQNDAYELYDKSSRVMYGTDRNGNYVEIQPNVVKGKGLLVAIPWSHREWLTQISQAVDDIAERTETVIRIVPIKKWRGR